MPPDPNAGRAENELSELLSVGFPAQPEAIGGVTDAITGILIDLKVPEQKQLEIALAVQEALVNAVVHGCKSDPSKQVRCRLQSDPLGRIVITVTDPGPGFSPDLLSDPKRQENLRRPRTRRLPDPPADGRSQFRTPRERNQDVEVLSLPFALFPADLMGGSLGELDPLGRSESGFFTGFQSQVARSKANANLLEEGGGWSASSKNPGEVVGNLLDAATDVNYYGLRLELHRI